MGETVINVALFFSFNGQQPLIFLYQNSSWKSHFQLKD